MSAEGSVPRLGLFTLRAALRRAIERAALSLYQSKSVQEKVELAYYLENLSLDLRTASSRVSEYWPAGSSVVLSGVIDRIDAAFEKASPRDAMRMVSILLVCFCRQWDDKLDRDLHGLDGRIFSRTALSFGAYSTVSPEELDFGEGMGLIPQIAVKTEWPSKPDQWRYDPNVRRSWGSNLSELLDSSSNLASFLEFVYADVEICAMEVCSHSILMGQDMPDEFVCDLARQIGDEARHAVAIGRMLREVGGNTDSPTYSGVVLSRYFSGESLEERLAIQHVIQESNSVEINERLVEALRAKGNDQWAYDFEIINRDEAMHATLGNRWVRHRLASFGADDDEAYVALVLKASERVGLPAYGKGAWNDAIRRSLGFPEKFIDSRAALAPRGS